MKQSYISNTFKSVIVLVLFACAMVFNINETQAQQVFKVEPIENAKALSKDSVNNFVSFNPLFAEGKTYLRWLVKNDRKDGVFIIERSDDGSQFEALGFKDRVATQADVNLFYSYVDENPPLEHAHYRVMQVGVDQTYNYSATVRVKTGATKQGASSSATNDDKK
jgi:hypothetical protein